MTLTRASGDGDLRSVEQNREMRLGQLLGLVDIFEADVAQ